MRIWKSASGISNGRKNQKFVNFWNFDWKIEKFKLKRFWKFVHFSIEKISWISNFENKPVSQILQFRKLVSFWSLTIWKTMKFQKISNVENYHTFQVFELFKQIKK